MSGYQAQLKGARFTMKIRFQFVFAIHPTQFADICKVV